MSERVIFFLVCDGDGGGTRRCRGSDCGGFVKRRLLTKKRWCKEIMSWWCNKRQVGGHYIRRVAGRKEEALAHIISHLGCGSSRCHHTKGCLTTASAVLARKLHKQNNCYPDKKNRKRKKKKKVNRFILPPLPSPRRHIKHEGEKKKNPAQPPTKPDNSTTIIRKPPIFELGMYT